MSATKTSCQIFCAVIDNYGDLGVCWRLARHLADSHDLAVTLCVDDLVSFQHLAPSVDPTQIEQMLGTIKLHHWQPHLPLPAPADLIIEAFACPLPEHFMQAMKEREHPPVWINLEYLSAETWIEGCHRLDSIDPASGLKKTFWFPGFTPASGGLLRNETEQLNFIKAPSSAPALRRISLFGYEQAALHDLLDTLASDEQHSVLQVFIGRALPDVERWLGQPLSSGEEVVRGALRIRVLALLPHAVYDQLLANSDLNLVRGEDSFVRAQWAGAAMLWHIYPQEEDAHLAKLAAWQHRVISQASAAGTPMPASWSRQLLAWNDPRHMAPGGWAEFLADLPAMCAAQQSWRQHLLSQPDLATQLMRFYADRVESRPK